MVTQSLNSFPVGVNFTLRYGMMLEAVVIVAEEHPIGLVIQEPQLFLICEVSLKRGLYVMEFGSRAV